MATLKHAFTNPKADGADATITRPSNWNADHVVVYGTRADVASQTIASGTDAIRTIGYTTEGDRGGGLYVKVGSEPSHPGKVQSADGAWWELVAENNEVWVEQFGAQRMAAYNSTTPDAWQAFEDAKTYIIANQSESLYGSITLRVGVGSYYLSRAFEMKGTIFHLKGMGSGFGGFDNATMLRFPINTDGIIVQRALSTGRNIYKWTASYNHGPASNGSLWYNAGNVYVAVTAGTSGLTGPTGTGTGIVDGAATWDWVRALEANEMVEKGCDGAQISGLQLWSYWTAVGDRGNYSGILGRARAHVTHCNIIGFQGCGIAFIANGDEDFPGVVGNVNNWYVGSCAMYYNGMDGLHIGYSDANAGMAEACDVSYNGRWGVADFSFLGNTHIGHHAAYNGRYAVTGQKQYPTIVTHDGDTWLARLTSKGLGPIADYSNEPGTDAVSWALFPGGGGATPTAQYPAWDIAGTYEPGGAYAANNVNARTPWIGCYSESGQPPSQFAGNDTVISGLHAAGYDSTATGDMLFDNVHSKRVSVGATYAVTDQYPGESFGVSLGPNNTPSNSLDRAVLAWNDWESNYFTLTGDASDRENLDYYLFAGSGLSTKILQLTGTNTLKKHGRASPVPNALSTGSLFLGPTATEGRWVSGADAVPSSGEHAVGEMVFNTSPVPGGNAAWQCTVAGTPGTWVKSGNLILENTAVYNPPSLSAGTVDTIQSMTVTGAVLGDIVDVSFDVNLAGIELKAWVQAANTVQYQFSCPAGGATVDLANGTVKCRVRK
jgi:hypothetical protein